MTPAPITVRGGKGAAAEVRAELTDRLAARISPEQLADLHLLATEVVTNSVRHGGVEEDGEVEVTLGETGDAIRVEVRDTGVQGSPQPRPPEFSAEGGFGLFLVEEIAARWGVEHEPRLVVWFELAIA
ncbi:MAG: serine/threonine-protein kinase RsbW [Thermoleophilaceae bacterium]|nr:serine/threonine-protein kinase RsbW [Thermoleophilaceae bacterium]